MPSSSSSSSSDEAVPNGNPSDCNCTTNVFGSTIVDEEVIKRLEEAHNNPELIIPSCCTNEKSEKTTIKPIQQTQFHQKKEEKNQQLL